jgi:phage terminase small subunit
MPVLDNVKHERFAQLLAQGKTATDAHEAAGFKRNDGNASKLAARPDVQARVKEITGAAAERCGVTVEKVVAELAKIGFSNMLDYMAIGADGQPVLDFSKLSRDQAACIQELVVETRPDPLAGEDEQEPQGHGGSLRRQKAGAAGVEILKVRFKLADKRAALVDLGKHLGMFKQVVEHGGSILHEARVIVVPAKEAPDKTPRG